MGRGDRDDRPPVELWVAPAQGPDPDVQRVEVGPARGGRPWGVAVVGVLALLLVVGLVAGDDGGPGEEEASRAGPSVEEERDNSPRNDLKPPSVAGRSTSTSTTSPAPPSSLPPGPVLGRTTGVSLVLAGTGTWTWLDLDTGERRDVLMGPAADAYSAQAVRGGVVVNRIGQVVLLSMPPTDAAAARVGRELRPGASVAVSSGSVDTVWLLSEPAPMERRRTVGTLVDLEGRVLLGPIDVSSQWIGLGTAEGMLFSQGGRVYLAGEGGARFLTIGDLFAAGPHEAVVQACDEAARCAMETVDTRTGETTPLPALASPAGEGWYDLAVGPDGRIAAGVVADEGFVLQVADGGSVQSWLVPGQRPSAFGQMRWLPGDLGVLVPMDGGGVMRFHLDEGGQPRQDLVPGLEDMRTEVLLVVPR